ncbi:hypothetical protein [Acinetobacter baumannii]|uniref:hypothetical protein n=1 Tax=Acinetobacter baumannii TaxID=470 RepID=UPI000DE73A56|nr:hypothetical protein [Acinetobacter baumannii]SSQ14270.1 Uncharacterised protein [Acinetobacter baumannii]SSS75968.1 Uncharacterised protein [Acinetobacter baumannii]
MSSTFENCFFLDTKNPYVFINGNDESLFLIKEINDHSFEYLDQKFMTKVHAFEGHISEIVRLATDKERMLGHRS